MNFLRQVNRLKYKSKTDWWLAVIIWGSMLLTIGIGVYALATEVLSLVELFILILLTILLPLGILWMWFTTFYVIDEQDLIIRYGPFKQKISLQLIKSMQKTMNPLSSPALSLKRMEITYGQYDFVLISPINRDQFMKELSTRCPNDEIKG